MRKVCLIPVLVMAVLLLWSAGVSASSVSITQTFNGDYGDSHNIPYFPSTVYDFSGEGFTAIDSFTLSLTFSGTNDQNYLLN